MPTESFQEGSITSEFGLQKLRTTRTIAGDCSTISVPARTMKRVQKGNSGTPPGTADCGRFQTIDPSDEFGRMNRDREGDVS